MTTKPTIPEKMTKRRVIVYKSRVDPTVIKLTAEKLRRKLFVKFGLSKPKPEQIQVVSIDKYYEPYILIDAKYELNYYKKMEYQINVDDETERVKILGTNIKPEKIENPKGTFQ